MRKMLTFLLVTASCALAADASGKWSGTAKPTDQDATVPIYLILKADGEKLTGSAGPNEGQQRDIESGAVKGEHVTFEVSTGKGKFIFDLKLDGDSLAGDLKLSREGQTGEAKATLTRVKG